MLDNYGFRPGKITLHESTEQLEIESLKKLLNQLNINEDDETDVQDDELNFSTKNLKICCL
jgi:hypothetical protein